MLIPVTSPHFVVKRGFKRDKSATLHCFRSCGVDFLKQIGFYNLLGRHRQRYVAAMLGRVQTDFGKFYSHNMRQFVFKEAV
jgi:hypothetical protein